MPESQKSLLPEHFSNFGELLRYLRERAHLSQRELAALISYHSSYVSYLEKNLRSADEASILGRFVPALGLEDEPAWVNRLIELSKTKKEDAPLVRENKPTEQRGISLPTILTSIIGREHELARLKKLILDPNIRLITLLGPPGVGKTCLALNVAQNVITAFTNGVVFVDLTPVRETSMLYPAIARALGVPETSNKPVKETVQAELSEKDILLVLDNFEQIVDAAVEILPLFSAAPNVKILVTSREVLRLRGEQEFHLSPLPLPSKSNRDSLDQLKNIPSISLFIERAQAVRPEFNLDEENASSVAEVCSRLDGLPLAIELAAARTRTLSLASMLDQFDRRFEWLTQGARDLPAWRQTLQGAIEWSVNLLSEPEQVLFQRLSIFNGGWTLDAAMDVCSDDTICRRADIFNLLIQLIDKSLVLPEDEGGHFNFLETLREFAFDGLTQSGSLEDLRVRHCDYFLRFAQTANPHILQGSEQLLWLQQMEREHDNLRQALGWSVEKADRVEIAMSFGTAVHIFWLTRSYLSEARTWLSLILTLDPTPTLVRAKLLRYASDYASTQGDFAQARLLEEEAMDISKQLGDEAGIYSSMDGIAMVAGMQGDYAHAVGLLEQVLAYRRRTGYNVSFIVTLNNLALATRLLGHIEQATALYEESISITRKEGIHPSLARALNGLAEIRALQKDYKSAVSLLREAILLRYQLGDLKGMVASLSSISLFTEEQGDMVLSAKLAGAATRLREELGLPIEPVKRSENEALLHRLRIKLGDKIFESAWQAGQSLDQKQLIDLIENTLSYNGK